MSKTFHQMKKAWNIVLRRLRTQGAPTTLLWLYGRGLPAITGVPLLQFSQVTPNLYVGPQFRANGKRFLLEQGIDACVNMRIERDDAAFGLDLPRYLHLPTIDDDAPSIEHLDQGVTFIREAIAAGSSVYIHCGAGVGRAPSMAAAYLMAEGDNLNEAIHRITRVRPFIALTPPQLNQLMKYEALVRGRNGTSRA